MHKAKAWEGTGLNSQTLLTWASESTLSSSPKQSSHQIQVKMRRERSHGLWQFMWLLLHFLQSFPCFLQVQNTRWQKHYHSECCINLMAEWKESVRLRIDGFHPEYPAGAINFTADSERVNVLAHHFASERRPQASYYLYPSYYRWMFAPTLEEACSSAVGLLIFSKWCSTWIKQK